MIRIWDLPEHEEDAVAAFQCQGIIASTKRCVNGHDMTLYLKTEKQWRCNVRGCDKRIAIRKDTFFEGSKLSFVTVLRFIYLWSKELSSVEFCKEELDLSDKTTIDWNHYMREVCTDNLLQQGSQKIGGPSKIVEIDTCLFSERKNNMGQILPQQWMFGGLCRETDECFLVKVPNRNADTLLTKIKENIKDGTIIFSDFWKDYDTAELKAGEFENVKVYHNYNFRDPRDMHTQSSRKFWGLAKWRNKQYCGTYHRHFNSYFTEFMWRRLHQNEKLFELILKGIKDFWPPK